MDLGVEVVHEVQYGFRTRISENVVRRTTTEMQENGFWFLFIFNENLIILH